MTKIKPGYLLPALACAALGGWTMTASAQEPAADAARGGAYSIAGDVSAAYANGEFVVWVSEPGGGGRGTASASMVPAGSASGASDPQRSLKDSLNVVAEAPIVDGKFVLEGRTDAPRNVHFYVLNAVSETGNRMAPVKGQAFVLEPGELTLTMNRRARFVVEGGHYNDIVVNSWRLSPEYLKLAENYYRTVKAVEGESEGERRARVDRSAAMFSEMLDLESDGRREVAMNHEDPLARKLTLESTWLRGPWMTEAVRALAEILPEDPWVIRTLASEEQYAANRAKAAALAVGTEIKDFEAETLEGEVVSVSSARKGKELVLVEFWASWCGPCRVKFRT